MASRKCYAEWVLGRRGLQNYLCARSKYLNPGPYLLIFFLSSSFAGISQTQLATFFSPVRLRVRIPAGAAGEFSSPESTLCADPYSVSVPSPVLPLWHVKDLGYSAKRAGGRLHLKTHTPLIQRSWNGLTMLLSRHSVGTCPETSSYANSQGTFHHSRLSSLSHCGLILAQRVELVCAS